MPLYCYQCACGLRFEASSSMKESQRPRRCPECGAAAERLIPTEVAGVFHQDVTGPGPQNTGLSQLDANIDRAIGESARKGWEVHSLRRRDKVAILEAHPDKRKGDLSLMPDGSYRLLEPEEKAVADRAHAINSQAEVLGLTKDKQS